MSMEHEHSAHAESFDGSDDNRQRVCDLLGRAEKKVEIFSPDLEPAIWSSEQVIDALKQLVSRNHRIVIHILVCEPRQVMSRGHRLVELARQHTSIFELRLPAPDHRGQISSELIVDESLSMVKPDAHLFEGRLETQDLRFSKLLSDEFGEKWELAEPVTEFRRLSL